MCLDLADCPWLGPFADSFLVTKNWERTTRMRLLPCAVVARLSGLQGFVVPCSLGVPEMVRHQLQGYQGGNMFK